MVRAWWRARLASCSYRWRSPSVGAGPAGRRAAAPAAAGADSHYQPPVGRPARWSSATSGRRPRPYAAGQPRPRLRHRARHAGAWPRPPARWCSPVRWPARLAVTVLHPDGLRTSYSFLATVAVRGGRRRSAQGQVDRHHRDRASTSACATRPGRYLDPEALFAGALARAPGARRRRGGSAPAARRGGVGRLGRSRRRRWPAWWPTPVPRWSPSRLAAGPPACWPSIRPGRCRGLAGELDQWRRSQDGCTPASAAPPPPAGRRIARAGGRGRLRRPPRRRSTTSTPSALGYAAGDVVRFSYNGGRAAGRPDAERRSGRRAAGDPLRLGRHPDRPAGRRGRGWWPLVAGLSRPGTGCAHRRDRPLPRRCGGAPGPDPGARPRASCPPQLATVVTISQPPPGRPTWPPGCRRCERSPAGEPALDAARARQRRDLDPDCTSLAQLSRDLGGLASELRQPLPAGVHLRVHRRRR